MDTSQTYIKMCEKSPEIQQAWQMPNGANRPDRAFSHSTIIYSREIEIKGGKTLSHFVKRDLAKENPGWLYNYNGKPELGLILARHGSSNNIVHIFVSVKP